MLKSQLIAALKASCFASFGAGFGFFIAMSAGFVIYGLTLGRWLPFDCSSTSQCGVTILDTLLAVLFWIFGTIILAIVAAVTGAIYAFPIVFSAGFMLGRTSTLRPPTERRIVWLLSGAVLGALWFMLLWRLQILPELIQGSGYDLPNPIAPLSYITAACVGGACASVMFRFWWQAEI